MSPFRLLLLFLEFLAIALWLFTIGAWMAVFLTLFQ